MLYAQSDAFNGNFGHSKLRGLDIVTGDNSCSELAWICCKYGYPASGMNPTEFFYFCKVGWDAVTGLGSPNFEKLMFNVLPLGDDNSKQNLLFQKYEQNFQE